MIKRLNKKVIFQLMGFLLIFNGLFMLLSSLISFLYKDGVTKEIFLAGLVTGATGLILRYSTKGFDKQVKKREGYVIVTLGWILNVIIWYATLFVLRNHS